MRLEIDCVSLGGLLEIRGGGSGCEMNPLELGGVCHRVWFVLFVLIIFLRYFFFFCILDNISLARF